MTFTAPTHPGVAIRGQPEPAGLSVCGFAGSQKENVVDRDELTYWFAAEVEACEIFRNFLKENKEKLMLIAHWGDGHMGYLIDVMSDELGIDRYPPPRADRKKKKKISRELWKKVMERDEYRCKWCKTHIDLCCDHIIPESKGGPTALDNLQALCRSCNSKKGVK